MSKYTDAYSATINAIAQSAPLFVLRDTLAEAKDAEKFIADAQAEVNKLKSEADKLRSGNRAALDEIAAIKATRAVIHARAVKLLNDEIQEKRETAAVNARSAEQAASARLAAISDLIASASTAAIEADERARIARANLAEVEKALAASERERDQAIAALQRMEG